MKNAMSKGLVVLVVVFIGFWLITDPRGLADIAQSAGGQGWEWGGDLFRGIIEFVRALG
jgi:hypothetical protein